MKEKIEEINKLSKQIKQLEDLAKMSQSTLNIAISEFLVSNKRHDRDRVLRYKSRIDTYSELIKLWAKE